MFESHFTYGVSSAFLFTFLVRWGRSPFEGTSIDDIPKSFDPPLLVSATLTQLISPIIYCNQILITPLSARRHLWMVLITK